MMASRAVDEEEGGRDVTRGRTRARVLRPGAKGGRLLSLSGGRGPRTVVRGSMGCQLDQAQLRSSNGMRCLWIDVAESDGA